MKCSESNQPPPPKKKKPKKQDGEGYQMDGIAKGQQADSKRLAMGYRKYRSWEGKVLHNLFILLCRAQFSWNKFSSRRSWYFINYRRCTINRYKFKSVNNRDIDLIFFGGGDLLMVLSHTHQTPGGGSPGRSGAHNSFFIWYHSVFSLWNGDFFEIFLK